MTIEASELYRPTAAWLPTARDLADWTGGRVADVADSGRRFTGLSTLAEAQESEISFAASEKAARMAASSKAGILIVGAAPEVPGRPRVIVEHVWSAVAAVMRHLYPDPESEGEIHPSAILGRDVKIGSGVSIGPYCVLGDGCEIGDGTILGPHCIVDPGCSIGWDCRLTARVTLKGRVLIGDRVVIHPGAVLGADGFKFEVAAGQALKIPQVGAVIIEDDVEIGANTTIDRAFLHETRIGRGVKIDNLVQIAHNVTIGPGSLLAAQVGIAGSTKIGAGALIGGSAGVSNGVTLGDRVVIIGGSKVYSDHGDGAQLMGYLAIDRREYAKIHAAMQRLPELLKRVRELEKKSES